MKNVEVPEQIDTWRIVCAAQSRPDLSEDRRVLCYASEPGAYHEAGPFLLLDGGHCSCYGWEDVTWSATEYTRDEIEALARSYVEGDCGCCPRSEQVFWESVCMALGIKVAL